MKLKRGGVAVIAANAALAAGLCDQNGLHFAASARDRIDAAPLAAVIATAFENELALTVMLAPAREREDARLS